MSASGETPPLGPAEASAVLRQLGDLTDKIVLVGGQALAFWASQYAGRFPMPGPVNSRDIDFCGLQDVVPLAAARLGGTWKVPPAFSNTPSTGLVEFVGPGGHQRRMDFLGDPFGLNYADVVGNAVVVEAPVGDGVVTFKVMNPLHCLRSRISNVGGLPGYQTRTALDQARVSVLCAREYVRDRLDAGDAGAAKAARRLDERIYRFAWENRHARNVFRDHAIDPFNAVLVDDRPGESFRDRRYPEMRRNLERRRSRGTGP